MANRAAFVERYGDVAVELDALPSDVVRSRLISEVEARVDLEALAATRSAQQAEQARRGELLDGLNN